MGKFQGPENMMSELGNWNSAMIYSMSEIARPLSMTTIYRDIAKHGYSSFIDDIINYNIPKDQLRFNGMKWLISELLKVIENSKSFLKVKGTKEIVEGYEERLLKIESLLKSQVLYKIKVDRFGEKTLKLYEDKFDKVLDVVLKIRTDLKTPLNRNDLIFINKEEFDPKEYKKQIMEDAVTKG